MYSQSYGSVRPSTKINNREPSTEHNGELEMKKNESTEIADSGIGVRILLFINQ